MGDYRWEEVTDPEILAEWWQWLKDHFDPGHYDAYKECDQSVLPYIDGRPQWVVDTYMPPHIEQRWLEKQSRLAPRTI